MVVPIRLANKTCPAVFLRVLLVGASSRKLGLSVDVSLKRHIVDGLASRCKSRQKIAARQRRRLPMSLSLSKVSKNLVELPGGYSSLPAAGPTAVACFVLGSMPISATPPTPLRVVVTTWPRALRSASTVSGKVVGTERLPRLARS